MQSNPIAEAWKANPLCREDFVKNILLRFYRPLIVGLVEEANIAEKGGEEDMD